MPIKPSDINSVTIYTYWDSRDGFICPLCSSQLRHEFNNGGRRVTILKGDLWVVTNYYSCTNSKCEMHEAFPAAYNSTMVRKRFSLNSCIKMISINPIGINQDLSF